MRRGGDGMKTIGQRLRYWRMHRKLSQEALAVQVGLSKDIISKMEVDKRNMHAHELARLARALGVDAYQLLGVPKQNAREDLLALIAQMDDCRVDALYRHLITLVPHLSPAPTGDNQ